jgi:uncharacterized protein YndB with AHSA1/START domain
MNDKFVYVTYIRTTQEKLWDALTKPEFIRVYWCGTSMDSKWTKGSSWKMVQPDGSISDAGEVLEAERPKRLVLKWRNEFKPELTAEGFSRCTFTLEPADEMIKLTVIHEMEAEAKGAKFVQAVSNGWPKILSSLKSYLETGTPYDFRNQPCAASAR